MKAVVSVQKPEDRAQKLVDRDQRPVDRDQGSTIKKVSVVTTFVLFSLSCLILNCASLRAEPHFFQKHAEGWHWYQDSAQLPEVSEQKPEVSEQKLPSDKLLSNKSLRDSKPLSPTEQIEGQRKVLETKLHAAIVEPSRENIVAYLFAQKALMDQSQRFSEAWQKVVMTTPALDETLTHPVDQNARPVYYEEKRKALERRIKSLSQEYGLFFFFRQNCPYCHGFAPLVKRFSETYGWSVLAVSLDRPLKPGLKPALSEFPNAKIDNGIAAHLKITHVPALIAVHPKTGQTIPLAYGMISESEIESRVELLTKVLPVSKTTSYEESFKR